MGLAKNNCLNPFAVVFSNAKGRYLPARNETSSKDSSGKRISTAGGLKQTKNLLIFSDLNAIPIEKVKQLNETEFLYQFNMLAKKYLNDKYEFIRSKKAVDRTTNEKYTIILKNIYHNKKITNLQTAVTQVGLQLNSLPKDIQEIFQAQNKLKELSILHNKKSKRTFVFEDLPNLPYFVVPSIKKFRDEILRNRKKASKVMNGSI